jgi:autotransporter family porin
LTLEQMTLQNGCVYANYGGAVLNSGTLTLSNCTLSGNTSIDRSDYLSALRGVGGAIYNGGTVIIENSILSNNLSTGANPMGGAIYNASGTVTISDSTFTNNLAYDTVLGIYVDPEYPQSGAGGAVFNESGTVTISRSGLTGNYASYAGGGLCNGFYYYSGGTVTVENSSVISGNTADDVQNSGTLYLQGGSTLDVLEGNAAISF